MKNRAISLRGRDFLSIAELDAEELLELIDIARDYKSGKRADRPLDGKFVAMLFQKPSHRTRVSFEVGIGRLGGSPITLGENDVQVGARESVSDAARVLDGYVDAVVGRMRSHRDLVALADAAKVPVINALTEVSHPCQGLADVFTIAERFDTASCRVAFIGDGNNVSHSLVEASAILGFPLVVITPEGHEPDAAVVEAARSRAGTAWRVEQSHDPRAVRGADVVYTDVWTSMGQEGERDSRRRTFAPYRVDVDLMRRAGDAIFMHCLPAHRGEEVTDEVIDGAASVVFQQAENRLYAQMALMTMLFT